MVRGSGNNKSLPFVFVCDLLNELDDLVNREDYLLPRYLRERRNNAVLRWFGCHYRALESCKETSEDVLAMLQPVERREGWVYGFSAEDLERIIARAFHLPIEYFPQLQRWRLGLPRIDLGACVEEIISKSYSKLQSCPPAQSYKISVSDIEHALLLVACHHPESSAAIRSFSGHNLYSYDTQLESGKPFRFDAASTFCVLFRQLNATQAKWLARILLKNFGPRKLFPDGLDLKASFRLPKCIEQFALPDQPKPGLLSFTTSLNNASTPMLTPVISISNPESTSLPSNQLKSRSNLSRIPNILPTPPTTIKKQGKRGEASLEPPMTSNNRQKRIPLGCIDQNSQPHDAHVSLPYSSDPQDSSPRKPPSKNTRSEAIIRTAGTGNCRLIHTQCLLRDFLFLLSPCISDDPWISDSLLSWHGSRFTSSTKAFVNLIRPAIHSRTEDKIHKVILIDTKRTTQTVEFLKRVQMQLCAAGGPKQWVEVYDWRLLEYMAKVDRGKEYTYDPWDRCRMCTI